MVSQPKTSLPGQPDSCLFSTVAASVPTPLRCRLSSEHWLIWRCRLHHQYFVQLVVFGDMALFSLPMKTQSITDETLQVPILGEVSVLR